jgi:enoyl-[acyl-carrier-protein] reductase (NADH)
MIPYANFFAGIDDTVRAVQAVGGKAVGYICDISKRANIYACAEKVKNQVGKVSYLIVCYYFQGTLKFANIIYIT